MAAVYKVVGGVDIGGAPVRDGRSLTSQLIGKLEIGAVVRESETLGERLRFEKLSGAGPCSGWVSRRLIEASHGEPAEVDAGHVGTSLLALAEAVVEQRGGEQALADAAARDQDGAALVAAAAAQLALGRAKEAAEATSEAKRLLADNRDGQASCLLLDAAAALCTGDGAVALEAAEDAMRLFGELGDRQMEASALTTCANARVLLRDLPAAQAAARDALAAFRDLGDARGEAAALATLTDAYAAGQGPIRAAKSILEDDLARCRVIGDKRGQGTALLARAQSILAESSGGTRVDVEEAVVQARRAAGLAQEAGERALLASALQTVASGLLFRGGSSEEALAVAEEALGISRSIGDNSCQVTVLNTITKAHLMKGDASEALASAEECRRLCEDLGDRRGETAALLNASAARLLGGDAAAALQLAREAEGVCQQEGDRQGRGRALQACANALMAGSGQEAAEARRAAREAQVLFRASGDVHGEAVALLTLASLQLGADGGGPEALRGAERARQLLAASGDGERQGIAAHLAAQAHLQTGDPDAAAQSAMQAVVLARDRADRGGEARALHTAARALAAGGRRWEALPVAEEAEALFGGLGWPQLEEAAAGLCQSIRRALPLHAPSPTVRSRPAGVAGERGLASLVQENPNCVVWAPALSQQTYLMYCLELLKLVEELKSKTSKTQLLCAAQGVLARYTGETVPSKIEGVYGMSMWAVVRTIRLESPRFQIACCDLPPAATADEVAECLRGAMAHSGARGEVSYVVDRRGSMNPPVVLEE